MIENSVMRAEQEIYSYAKGKPYREALGLPDELNEEYIVLAQGEYNKNYLFTHPVSGKKLVLRVNFGSQMHLNHQIEYEATALRLIEPSGRTPKVHYVDESDDAPGSGVLVMDYLSGRALDYTNDEELKAAAKCLADIHSVRIDEKDTTDAAPDDIPADAARLIAPRGSMKAVLSECEQMLAVYMESDSAPEDKKNRLRTLLDSAWRLAEKEEDTPYKCCINTELNSTNFLVDCSRKKPFVRLIDWEKPLYGDPAQDLAHFLAPTTTFWKTDVIFDDETTERFIDSYINAADRRLDTSGLRERTLAMIPITCLRGMTWCAMAWVQYRDADKELVNESTAEKLDDYLSMEFISDIEKRVRV